MKMNSSKGMYLFGNTFLFWCTFMCLVTHNGAAQSGGASGNGTVKDHCGHEMDATLSGEGELPAWSRALDQMQLVLSCIGIFANAATLFTLLIHGNEFQDSILFLFRHQSFIDTLCCLFGVLLMIPPPEGVTHWLSGYYRLDIFICHAWHGQEIFWGCIGVSIYNLVAIAAERYVAVCRPLQQRHLTLAKKIIILVIIYFISIFFTAGALFQVRLVDGVCKSECYFSEEVCNHFMPAFAVQGLFGYWIIPCLLFLFLYGSVVRTLHQRRKESTFATSTVIEIASKQLTRTGLAVTTVFFICLGYDLWYYVLGYTCVTTYKMGAPVQKIGVMFAAFNSVANPFVYAILMPAYRRSVWNTLTCTRLRAALQGETSTGTTLSELSSGNCKHKQDDPGNDADIGAGSYKMKPEAFHNDTHI